MNKNNNERKRRANKKLPRLRRIDCYFKRFLDEVFFRRTKTKLTGKGRRKAQYIRLVISQLKTLSPEMFRGADKKSIAGGLRRLEKHRLIKGWKFALNGGESFSVRVV